MKNLVTRRRSGVFVLLVALMMFAAGLLVSAPAKAATGSPATATLVLTNAAGTTGYFALEHSFMDQPVLFVVKSSTKGDANVTVQVGAITNVPFGPDSGTVKVQYLNSISESWIVLATYTVPTVDPNPTPSATTTATPSPTTTATQTATPTETTQPTPTETAPKPPADNTGSTPYTFCHANHNRAESYEKITTSVLGFLNGHQGHEGDILPPVTYVKGGEEVNFLGQRWNADTEKIFNNNCSVVLSPPSPTETVTPSPTSTETSTATPSPSSTETATASPSSTETTSATPSETSKAIPSETETIAATAKASRYPAAYVDTAVAGSSQATPAPLLFTGAALLALIGGLLFRGESHVEGRRH